MRAVTKRIAERLFDQTKLCLDPKHLRPIARFDNTTTDYHNVWLHDNHIVATSWYGEDDDMVDNVNYACRALLRKNETREDTNIAVTPRLFHLDPNGIAPKGPYGRGHEGWRTNHDGLPLPLSKKPIMWFSFAGWPTSTTRERLNGMLESTVYQKDGEQYCNGFHLPNTMENIWYLDMGKDKPPFQYKTEPWDGVTATAQLVPIGWPTLHAEEWWAKNEPRAKENTVSKHQHNTGGILIG